MMLAPRASQVSWTSRVLWASRKSLFTSQIASLMLNFSTVWLVGCWLTLATLRWNRNQVYSSITLTPAMLHWRELHIVNQALAVLIATVTLLSVLACMWVVWCCPAPLQTGRVWWHSFHFLFQVASLPPEVCSLITGYSQKNNRQRLLGTCTMTLSCLKVQHGFLLLHSVIQP